MTPRKDRGKLNPKLALNTIRVESLPYYSYTGSEAIVPYGEDNLYPQRIINAIKKSPTAKGCVKRFAEFVIGNGAGEAGEMIVNRSGETLNDIISQSVRNNYARLGGLALHLNFNVFGQVAEIYAVDMQYLRKHRGLKGVSYGIWEKRNSYFGLDHINIELYGECDPVEGIGRDGLFGYKGQVFWFSLDNDIYPDAPIDSASISADFEREAQIYPYANIRNGFSGNTIAKLPTLTQGEKSQAQADGLQEKLEEVHGAENAGSTIVVPVPVDAQGNARNYQMIEHLSPTNVDSLFVNQNEKAQNDILKVYTMPEILLGISSQGMFNEASFNDAFNYKNADTEGDRKIIERTFKKVLKNSVFDHESFEIIPLEMKGGAANSSGVESENLGNEVLRGLTGRQKRQLLNEVDKYKREKITRDQLDVLMKSYGLNDDEIEKMLL